MPAVELVRLQNDTQRLLELFHQPDAFVLRLQELLDFLSDHTARAGQSGAPRPLMRAYNVPRHLLAYITREACRRAGSEPPAALALIQALWAPEYLELRLMAAAMLGSLPARPPEPVLAVVDGWLAGSPEQRLLQAILTDGLAAVRREQPQALLAKIDGWVNGSRRYLRKTGLACLAILAESDSVELPPQVFDLLQPLVYQLPDELKQDVLELVRSLAQRLPAETAFLLRQGLDTPNNAKATWVLRNAMDSFPEGMQPDLRQALRNATRSTQ
jgi:hypothetical protein